MEFRISQNFAMDESTFFAIYEEFFVSRADLGVAMPGTRVNAVAVQLAGMPWADPQESLRAVQVACALTGVANRFDWIKTEQRARMKRNAAQAVDGIWRAALSGKPILDRTTSKTPAA